MSAAPCPNSGDRLYTTMEAVLGVPPGKLSEESSPDSIGEWDSLMHLTLVIALEGEFGVRLSAEDTLEMRNVGSIRSILRDRGATV